MPPIGGFLFKCPFTGRCSTTYLKHMTTSTPVATPSTQQQPARWADANSMTFTGRVFHAELVTGRYGEFVSVDVISRPVEGDDDSSVILHFNSSSLVPFFKAGGVPTGRVVTVTGAMTGIESSYTDKQSGEVLPLKRQRIRLGETILSWGPKPAAK